MSKQSHDLNDSLVNNFSEVKTTSSRFIHGNEATNVLFPLEITLVVIGAIESFIIFLDFLKHREFNKKPSATLLLHLCLTDFSVIVTTAVNSYLRTTRARVACPIGFACFITARYANMFTMVILSFERHKSLTKPFQRKMRNSEVLFYITVSWILTIANSSPMFIPFLNFAPKGCKLSSYEQTPRLIYFTWLLISQYVIPLIILAVLNAHTYLYMKRTALNLSKNVRQRSCSDTRKIERHSNKTSKVFRTLFYMILNFALCMLPQNIMLIYLEFHSFNFSAGREVKELLIQVIFFDMVLVNAVLNFLLYGSVNRKFKCEMLWRWIPFVGTNCNGRKQEINKRKYKTETPAICLQQLAVNSSTLNDENRLRKNSEEYNNEVCVHAKRSATQKQEEPK